MNLKLSKLTIDTDLNMNNHSVVSGTAKQYIKLGYTNNVYRLDIHDDDAKYRVVINSEGITTFDNTNRSYALTSPDGGNLNVGTVTAHTYNTV